MVFASAGDLWMAPASGGTAQRITRGPDQDRRPFWSHDGTKIAFARLRAGVLDVWILDLASGASRALTDHQSADWPSGFTSDDAWVLFHSPRSGEESIYRVPARGGEPERLTFDLSVDGQLDPGGRRLIFARGSVPWWQQGYRGSAAYDLYLLDLGSRRARQLTEFDGCDLWPRWEPDGTAVIFASDESFARNLWRLDLASGRRSQLTVHRDGPVEFPQISADGRWLVYAQNGTLWRMGVHPVTAPAQIPIRCPQTEDGLWIEEISPPGLSDPGWGTPGAETVVGETDRRGDAGSGGQVSRRSTAGATRLVPSPSGAFVVIEAYGGLFKFDPSERGAPADSAAAKVGRVSPAPAGVLGESSFREDGVTISPDGSRIVFSSDRADGRDLYYLDLPGVGAVDSLEGQTPTAAAAIRFRDNVREEYAPRFSPDGRFIAYRRGDVGEQLMLADAEGGRETILALGARFGAFAFSPDSRWVSYARLDEVGNWDIHVVPLFSGDTYNVSEHPAQDVDPQWSADGKMLFYRSDRAGSMDIWAVFLHEEEAWESTLEATSSSRTKPAALQAPPLPPPLPTLPTPLPTPLPVPLPAPPLAPPSPEVSVDLAGVSHRTIQVTSFFGDESEYALAPDGSIAFVAEVLGAPDLWRLDRLGGSPRPVTTGGRGPRSLSWAAGSFWALDRDGAVCRETQGSFEVSRFQARQSHRQSERHAQIMNEIWRELRDGFYSPHMHLAPWEALLTKYRARLSGVGTDEDLHELVLRMVGELNASHLGFRAPPVADSLRTGDLGLVFAAPTAKEDRSGGLLIREVLAGGPAARAGLVPGDRLLSVRRFPVGEAVPLEQILRGRVGSPVALTWRHGGQTKSADAVAASPDLIRTLRQAQTVGWRRQLTERLSDGRIGYVAPLAIDRRALDDLARELRFFQKDKGAIVLDLRANGGGDLPEEFLRRLTAPGLVGRQPRDERPQPAPGRLWDRPLAVLIGPGTGSAAEIVAAGLSATGTVRLLGEPTYGGVIGASEITLLDGAEFRIPRIGWFTASGDNLEGRGVTPDLIIESEFEEESRGEDRALVAAVRELRAALKNR